MPSNDQFPPPPDLAGPLNEMTQWLASAALHCALGLLLGALAANMMRRHHLHWSWASLALVLFACLHASLPLPTSTLLIAALLASVRGRRWHRHDLDSGVDLTEIALARTTPGEFVRRLGSHLGTRLHRPHGGSGDLGTQPLALGVDERGAAVTIPFGAHASGRHTLVVGATGSGKTVTQSWIATCAIERGMGAIVLDPKGDRGMREQLQRSAELAGRRFLQWTPAGPCVYNPYGHGGATEIADKTLAGERFTEPHYMRQAQRYLGHAVRALRASGREVSLREIVQLLDPEQLDVLARGLPEGEASPVHAYLDSLTHRQQSDLAGVRDRLAILVESDVGPWLDPSTRGAVCFDLLTAVRDRAVVYFGLDADRRPLLAQMLGSAVVQDLQTTVSSLQASPTSAIAVIDEFSAVASEQVVRLFGRARSAGLSLVLGTQELSDLRIPGAGRLLEQVMGNLSTVIAHRQVVPSSAELISDVAGSHGVWKVSRHSDGRSTRTRSREAVLDPTRVMQLSQGSAAVIALDTSSAVRITRMFSPERGGTR